jgi:glycerol uptake facilitator-like aquaporin
MNYLIEFMGTLLICCTVLFTHANPIAVGLAHTSALYIAKDAHFSPLVVYMHYSMGRLTLKNALTDVAIQAVAALCAVLTYAHIPLD